MFIVFHVVILSKILVMSTAGFLHSTYPVYTWIRAVERLDKLKICYILRVVRSAERNRDNPLPQARLPAAVFPVSKKNIGVS